MKTVIAKKYVIKGYNNQETDKIPKGWIISSRDVKKPEVIIVDSIKYIDDTHVTFYENDGTVKERMISHM